MAERRSSDEDGAPDSKLVASKRPQAASFVAKAKDEAYKASEIVKKDATAVEHMAQRVEKLSRSIEDDVDHVESALHQMITTTDSREDTKSILDSKGNDSSIPSTELSYKDGNSTTKSSLTFEWPSPTVSHVLFILLTLCIMLFHVWGDSFFSKIDKELANNNTLLTAKKSTAFSILLIYLGTIWRVLKSFRSTMGGQKDAVIKVEEKVHEIGREVKTVAKDIEEIADTVEHRSRQIEEEASQIQSLIRPVDAA